MNNIDWLQQLDKPLFPDIIWSRPETIHGAGKLTIIGGQAQEFAHVAASYTEAEKAGAGVIRVLMPESTRKVTSMLPNIEYADANLSGSFSRLALNALLNLANWGDGTLLAGDLGKNSETSLVLEKFITDYDGLIAVSSLARPSITISAKELYGRGDTILSLTFNDFQKDIIALGHDKPVTSATPSSELAAILRDITEQYKAHLIVATDKFLWTAGAGQVASTKFSNEAVDTAISAKAAVWAMQNPTKLFEAITTAAYC